MFIIVFAQFCCTSLWFAGNGVMSELITNFKLHENVLGHLTSVAQFGFILGTIIFAILNIPDRFSPSKVFLICAIMGALCNLEIIYKNNTFTSLIVFRFATGFFLAGIYPVGMKIAADYFNKGLGKSLGFLVGALVLGTAFPHLAKELTSTLSWIYVILTTSTLAVLGGFLIFILVPDGPYRKAAQQFNLSAFWEVFEQRKFRSAALGYFGHMWELYAFWAFVPMILKLFAINHQEVHFNVPLLSFIIISTGGASCIIGGFLAQKLGTVKIARYALGTSGLCCLISPFVFLYANEYLFLGFLVIWGASVIADSPLLSTLVANSVKAEIKGTALTIVNCIGFSITIFSIQLLNSLQSYINPMYIYTFLAIGPILGLIALRRKELS